MSTTGNRFIKYGLILFFGSVFSAYFFYSVNDKYLTRNNALIETSEAKVQVKLINELDKLNLAMESIETLIKNTDSVPQTIFSELTNPFLEELNGILLLGWGPRLHECDTENAMFNCKGERDSIRTPCQKILAMMTTGGICVPKFDQQSLATTSNTEIDENYKEYLSNTIADAVSSRKPVISKLFPLLDKDENSRGFISAIPVYDAENASIKGISFGLFDLNQFINATLIYELPILDVAIRDKKNHEVSTVTLNQNMNSHPSEGTLNLGATIIGWDVIVNPKATIKNYPHSAESYFVLLLGLFSSVLIVFVVKQRDGYSIRLSKEVKDRTKELEDSNTLKETLLREIHHRVKNNLQIASSLMNLQKRKLTDPYMIEAFTSSQGRISAIALIHEEIYQHRDTKAVDFENYLNDLIKYHRKISPSVSYEIDCPEITLDLDTAVPVALITSELLVNSLKHAFPDDEYKKFIRFKVREQANGFIKLLISDNGKGLPCDFDITNSSGLGFEIVNKLCRQINANFKFSSNPEGTTFIIIFRPMG
ncbi:MAG: histidine kinase dimerization/phosphoacceptor domain -containing protein [Pricia sp.]